MVLEQRKQTLEEELALVADRGRLNGSMQTFNCDLSSLS